MNLYEPCTEEVRVSFERKKAGQFRRVFAYGLENRARQYLVKFALEPFSGHGDYQFDDVNRAVEHVNSALSSGYKWAVLVDLKDCFPSLDAERREELIPLPRRVVRHVIAEPPGDVRVLGTTPGSSILFLAKMWNRLGLPQGSAASNLVAKYMIALALKEIPSLSVTAFYIDDGIFLTKTKEEAEQIKDALYRVFSVDGPVGHIDFKLCHVRHASSGFDFLGYHIRRVGNKGVCIPAEGKTAVVRQKVSHFLARNRYHDKLRGYVKGWCAAHRHWEHAPTFREHLIKRIDAAERLGYDPSPPYGTETMVAALLRMASHLPKGERAGFFDTVSTAHAAAIRMYAGQFRA